jgi:hypothetical protein
MERRNREREFFFRSLFFALNQINIEKRTTITKNKTLNFLIFYLIEIIFFTH